jgi:hypothetical protein
MTEISAGCADGSLTRVSRAVLTRTVNYNGHSYPWNYTWGALAQDDSITNYVRDSNGNETAHVFCSATTSPSRFYEVETLSYQGMHSSGHTAQEVLHSCTGVYYLLSIPWGYNASQRGALGKPKLQSRC